MSLSRNPDNYYSRERHIHHDFSSGIELFLREGRRATDHDGLLREGLHVYS